MPPVCGRVLKVPHPFYPFLFILSRRVWSQTILLCLARRHLINTIQGQTERPRSFKSSFLLIKYSHNSGILIHRFKDASRRLKPSDVLRS